jgi:hypothetical protein
VGVPLSVVYLLLYWISATFVLMLIPAWTFKFTTRAPFWLIALVIVANAVIEEIVVTALPVQWLAVRGIAVSALLRSVWHLVLGPLAAVSVLAPGILFATLYWQRRTLWPLIVAQALANLAIFAFAPG